MRRGRRWIGDWRVTTFWRAAGRLLGVNTDTSATRRSARLSPRARKIWLTAHVATSVGWLGSAYTMLVLGLAALRSADLEFRITVYEIMHLFDRAVNIPLFLGALITGLVVSLRTKWGLFRHWWVSVKLALSLLVAFGAYLLSVPRVLSMISIDGAAGSGSTATEIVAILRGLDHRPHHGHRHLGVQTVGPHQPLPRLLSVTSR